MKTDGKRPHDSWTRRGWFAAVAGLAGALASAASRRARPDPAAETRRRRPRRFWIGHT